MNPSQPSIRRYDIDWLRIIAVFLLVPFHSALTFSLDPRDIVYIKDTVNSPRLLALAGFINIWHMPLLFVIAGASSWYALHKRSSGQYLQERLRRLLIPALFGVVVLIPPMTYIHLIGKPGSPTFWQHFAGFFRLNPDDLSGMGGTLTPAHLWFIIFLFLFSLVALPFFLWLKGPAGERTATSLGRFLSKRGVLMVLVAPLVLTAAIPLLGDKNPIHYLLMFILGFVLMSDPGIQQAIDRDRRLYTWLAVVCSAGYFLTHNITFDTWSVGWMANGVLFEFCRWVWVISILGIGHRWLNANNAVLRYASEAAFPFYILHLPVNTLIGFWVIQLPLSVGLKYLLIVLLTTLISLALYEALVRRIPFMRFLFGVKARKPAVEKIPQTVQVGSGV